MKAAVVLVLVSAGAGCAVVGNDDATEKCRAVQSKDDCKACCSRNRATGHLWSYSTAKGGTCTCRGRRL